MTFKFQLDHAKIILEFCIHRSLGNIVKDSFSAVAISEQCKTEKVRIQINCDAKSEYSKSMDSDKFVEDGKLKLTSVNIQNFVSSSQYAEELLEFFRSLFKDNLINKLSFEAIVFASKVRESKHPNWLKVLVPKA